MSALLEDKFMRVLLLFDLPTTSKKEQKNAAKFRNELIKLGFFMMQFSVYMRICKGSVSANAVISRVRGILPPLGNVRALIITEKQFDNMQILLGSAGFNESVNDDKNLVLFAFDEKICDYRYSYKDEALTGEEIVLNEEIELTELSALRVAEQGEPREEEAADAAAESKPREGDKEAQSFASNGKRGKKRKDKTPTLFEF